MQSGAIYLQGQGSAIAAQDEIFIVVFQGADVLIQHIISSTWQDGLEISAQILGDGVKF